MFCVSVLAFVFVLCVLCFSFHFCFSVVGFLFLFSILCLCCGFCVSALFLSATVIRVLYGDRKTIDVKAVCTCKRHETASSDNCDILIIVVEISHQLPLERLWRDCLS